MRVGSRAKAVTVLRAVQQLHPGDFWLNHELAAQYPLLGRPEEATSFYRAALAARPDNPVAHADLALHLSRHGKHEEAIPLLRRALVLKPDYVWARALLGSELWRVGLWDEAFASLEQALALSPNDFWGLANLGTAHRARGNLDLAIRFYQQALRVQSNIPMIHQELGWTWEAKGDLAKAEAAYRDATRLPMCDRSCYCDLARLLEKRGAWDEAIQAYETALRQGPFAPASTGLGRLATLLANQADFDRAVRCRRSIAAADPSSIPARLALGHALRQQGKLDYSARCFQGILFKSPDCAEAHRGLGMALQAQGRFIEARASFHRGHELDTKRRPQPSARWLKDCERLIELEGKLTAVLEGKLQPATPAERLEYAWLCVAYKKRPAAATRFYEEAFAADSTLAENLSAAHRYNAACSAALAACGQGSDAAVLDETKQADFRQKALRWLRADLDAWKSRLEKEPAQVKRTMAHWRHDRDFAGVRGPEALARLSTGEREAWQQLWKDVDTLSERAAK
jgi:serine/threonine-protein kinase